MTRTLLIFLVLSPTSFFSQSTKFLAAIDSTYVPVNHYLQEYSVDSFFTSGLGDIQIATERIDTALFNASLFFSINKERKRKGKRELVYEPHLDFLAYNCVSYFKSYKFKPSTRNNLLYEKNLYLASRNVSMKCHLFSVNTCLLSFMDVDPKRPYHRDKTNFTSNLQLYYRNPEGQEDKVEEGLETLTYNEFTERVLDNFQSRRQKRKLLSHSYEIMACYIVIDRQSIGKSRLPVAKVIQIAGARRLPKSD